MELDFDAVGRGINSATQGEVASDLIRQVSTNADFGKQLYDLYDGKPQERNFNPMSVDIERIRRIVKYFIY
jgi:hypothetical protein